MALLPLRQAANAVGVSRQTLYRYVKDGRISASVGHDGQKQVDTSELLRVFGKLDSPSPAETAVTATSDSPRQPETGPETALVARLEADLAAARTMLDATKSELTATREREHKLLDIVQNQTRLLEYRAPEPAASSSPPWPWIALVLVVALVVVAVTWSAPARNPSATATPSSTPPVEPAAR